MERWFLYSRNSIAPAIRRLNAEVIVTDAHKQSTPRRAHCTDRRQTLPYRDYGRVARHPVGIHEHGEVGHFRRASRSSLTLSATLRPVVSITMCLRSQGSYSRETTSSHVGSLSPLMSADRVSTRWRCCCGSEHITSTSGVYGLSCAPPGVAPP